MSSAQLSIHDAATMSGLNPSVIRVWENRYGWPSPRRQPNGYRTFTAHEVEDLKRVAALVKSGIPIRSLIEDGLPKFPQTRDRQISRQELAVTRGLPATVGAESGALREALCRALEDRHDGHAQEIIQRACLELRPGDELTAVLIPALIGLAELRQLQRPLAREAELVAMVHARCDQLVRRFATTGEQVVVDILAAGDEVLASGVIALLASRGIAARLATESDAARSSTARLVVSMVPPTGERDGGRTVVTPLPCEGCIPMAQLLERGRSRAALLDLSAHPTLVE